MSVQQLGAQTPKRYKARRQHAGCHADANAIGRGIGGGFGRALQ